MGEGGCDFILLEWILGIIDEGEKCKDRVGEGAGSKNCGRCGNGVR